MTRTSSILLRTLVFALLLAVSLAVAMPALAASAPRTFVASYGNDANPCTLTQPCRGFVAAGMKTSVGGEIIVLDSAGYGRVRLFQSISIIAPPGVYAGISVDTDNGVWVDDSGSGATVTLRGLTITAAGGSNGIGVTNVGKLIVDRCVLSGFYGAGVEVDSANAVSIIDTTVADSSAGVAIRVGARANPTQISIHGSSLLHDFNGVVIDGNVNGEIDGSVLASSDVTSGGTGIQVSGGPIELHVANSTITGFHEGVNLMVVSPYASVSVTHSELTNNKVAARTQDSGLLAMEGDRLVHNGQALAILGSGVAFSAGENYFALNVSDGVPFTATAGLK
jgi:Right handed beta helix region